MPEMAALIAVKTTKAQFNLASDRMLVDFFLVVLFLVSLECLYFIAAVHIDEQVQIIIYSRNLYMSF